MATVYRQGDSKWASHPYAGENMAAAGCGPTSVAILVDQSPVTVADWMQNNGYASNGSGTYWEGISAGLSHFGGGGKILNYNSLLGTNSSNVFETWRSHIKSGYTGVLLMGVGTNSYWTKGGHYISITKYDAASDQYYVIDPASAARDGWHPWSDFAYNVKVCFTSTIKWSNNAAPITPTGSTTSGSAYSFSPEVVKIGSVNNSVLLLQEILMSRGIYTGTLDKSFGNLTLQAVKKYQTLRNLEVDGICGPKTWADLLAL